MAKATALEQALSKLAAIRANPAAPGAADELARALENKTNLVAERAAKIICEQKLLTLAPAMEQAFDRFMSPGSDKGCGAKTAIATTLYELGADAADIFLAGIRHVQMEPVWGGSQDVAAELRGICALGLVRIAHRDALLHVSDLLTDPQPQARIIAARALAYSGRDEAALPLRVKIRSGDREAEVTAECITALVKLTPQKSVELAADYLSNPDEMIRESAALALGESRRREAFDVLREHVEQSIDPELRRPHLLAIAVSRLPEAIRYLTESLGSWDVETVKHALDALHIYRHDEAIQNAVGEAVALRTEVSVRKKYQELFK
jgi:HEAT repeat protein